MTISVKDANGNIVDVELPAAVGRKAAAASKPVALSDEDAASLAAVGTKLDTIATYVDGLEGYTDGLETQIGATNETAPGTDTATSGLNGRLQRIAQRVTSLIALLPASLGAKTSAGSLSVTLSTDDDVLIGATNETAPTTDTATSGLNGRLQRIAQRLTSLIALLPSSIGGKTANGSLGVTLASDDPAVATLGATSGAAVTTDANGTIQQYLRGLVKQWIAGTLVIGAGTNLIGKVKTKFIAAAGTALTRPANTTPYTAGDSVSNNGTAGSVGSNSITISDVNDEPFSIERFRLLTSDTGFRGKSVRVYLYSSDPTANSGVGAGDNTLFSNKVAGLIGSLSGTFTAASGEFSDGGLAELVPDKGARIIAKPVSGAMTLYWQLKTLDDATPSANSTTFTPTVEGFQGGS